MVLTFYLTLPTILIFRMVVILEANFNEHGLSERCLTEQLMMIRWGMITPPMQLNQHTLEAITLN